MAENSKGQMPQHENADKKSSGTHVDENVRTSRTASEQGAQPLNEKSSTTGRGTSGRGLSSKDGVTGSDLDGQVTY